MSKEKMTPIEKQIERAIRETLVIDNKGSIKFSMAKIRAILTKEKEQRKELIKKTYADALINLIMLEEGKISKEEMEMINKRAEQYCNEVIKKRY
jgi:hypothetical protein